MKLMPRISRLTIFSASLWLSFAQAETGMAAKALFFSTDGQVAAVSTAPVKEKKAPNKNDLGVSYAIRLVEPNGSFKEVLASRVFRSGERFQLALKVNSPTHVYVFNQDTTGKVVQLHPQPGKSSFVNIMGTALVPERGSFEFDGVPGVENLTIILSKKEVDKPQEKFITKAPDVIVSADRLIPASVASKCEIRPDTTSVKASVTPEVAQEPLTVAMASKGISFNPESYDCSNGNTMVSKGISFTDDASPKENIAPASYAVKRKVAADDFLQIRLQLVHK